MKKEYKEHTEFESYRHKSPRKYYTELAELGLLMEYVESRMAERFRNDKAFREEIVDLAYIYSPNAIPELERHLLEQLCEGLQYFLEYTHQWTTQKP